MGQDKKSAHDASASATGYLYQCRYALLRGLQAVLTRPELQLSIERFDDVAFLKGNDPIEQVQVKHHVSHQGNLTDTSDDLWRTLRVWCGQVQDDPEVALRTEFILLTTSTAPEGSAASMLRAQNRDDSRAREILLAAAAKSKSIKNKPGYDAFRALPEQSQRNLLAAIHIADRSANVIDVWDDICRVIRLAVSKEHVEKLAERLEGWWFGAVVHMLVNGGSVPIISLENKIDELREDFSRSGLPVDYHDAVPTTDIVAALDRRPFVAQLRRVNIGTRRIEWAIRDYYRASEQRSKWARERLLVDGEVERYERELIEAWQPRFAGMVDGLPEACAETEKIACGQVLYKWVETEASFPLRSLSHHFLTHGSFHILSNRFAVGWHPDFEAIAEEQNGGAG